MLSRRQGGVARAWQEADPAEDEQSAPQQSQPGSAESKVAPSALSAPHSDDDSDDGWGGWGEASSRSSQNSSVGAEPNGDPASPVSLSDTKVVKRCARRPDLALTSHIIGRSRNTSHIIKPTAGCTSACVL